MYNIDTNRPILLGDTYSCTKNNSAVEILLRCYGMELFFLVNISVELFEQTYIKTKNFFRRTPCTIQSKLPAFEEIGVSCLVEEQVKRGKLLVANSHIQMHLFWYACTLGNYIY